MNAAQQEPRLLAFSGARDCRGTLCFLENGAAEMPFDIKRVFWIYGVPAGQERGYHAHRTCSELVFALSGSVEIVLTWNGCTKTFVLDSPTRGLLIPPMCWCVLRNFSPDCVCFCAADRPYEEEGYIHDRDQFLEEVSRCGATE